MLYEEHRPPRERWYELKTSDFNKELHRNVMENRPNDQNRKFLNKVVIKELY